MNEKDVTLCLTIGRRPELLRQTLSSLQQSAQFAAVIAINDFRDEPTNEVFRELCPNGTLICLDEHLGHHPAVDTMYREVHTPYILHCEDDWLFNAPLCLADAKALLDNHAHLSSVCLRKYSDLPITPAEQPLVRFHTYDDVTYAELIPLHAQWYGYSFNPHLARTQDWKDLGGFSQFKKERHISRYLRKRGQFVAYLCPGACEHIGFDDSVANPPKQSVWQKIQRLFA